MTGQAVNEFDDPSTIDLVVHMIADLPWIVFSVVEHQQPSFHIDIQIRIVSDTGQLATIGSQEFPVVKAATPRDIFRSKRFSRQCRSRFSKTVLVVDNLSGKLPAFGL